MHPALHARLVVARRLSTRLLQIACFVHLFHEHVLEIRQCAGPSMYPTLALSGDHLVSLRTSFLKLFVDRQAPHVSRGDLIDFVSPKDPSYSVCKRVIGLEGDVVLLDPSDQHRRGANAAWIRVPTGYLWVTGDNLSNSVDSREYGPVPLGLVRGKIVARIWPNPRWLTAGKDRTSVIQ